MDNRRLSAADKGKAIVSEPYQAPRKARVRVPEPANSYLLQKHSLTLIGRVTNPSVQKIWSLLPFFAERWATETRPMGSDLGQDMFQFQFDKEEDLLRVLEKRSYQYAKWMVIVERWNPTMATDFPSLIPFWIKVQGIPVHLWTEGTIRAIGEDIGVYEEAEINSLNVRMRVQVNGRLPLITSSVVEFPKGEVTATLVYEQLAKHCSYCNRLDHEARDCLKAKAEKKEKLTMAESNKEGHVLSSKLDESSRMRGRPPSGKAPSDHHRDVRMSPYSRPNEDYYGTRQYSNLRDKQRQLRDSNTRRSEDKDSQWQRGQDYRYSDREGYSHSAIHHGDRRNSHHSSLREDRGLLRDRGFPRSEGEKEESSASRRANPNSARGTPLQRTQEELPKEALKEAIGDIHNAMKQYTSIADPTESAARRERYRQVEEQGEIEETAAQMVRASLNNQENLAREGETSKSPIRVPALLRLGPSPPPAQAETNMAPQPDTQRKPGRPPGAKKRGQSSPKIVGGGGTKLQEKEDTTN